VAENLCLNHIVVNHSEGFTNAQGEHTNNIENFWSCMKSEVYKQHGVQREKIDVWLDEFSFRRKFLNGNSKTEKIECFHLFIK
jgi:transposase-like protein